MTPNPFAGTVVACDRCLSCPLDPSSYGTIVTVTMLPHERTWIVCPCGGTLHVYPTATLAERAREAVAA